VALDVWVKSSGFETKRFGECPDLDVSATYNEERRRLSLPAVNRRKEGDVTGIVELVAARVKPGGRAFCISGANPEVQNTFEDPHAVSTQEVRFSGMGNRFEYQFPRHSVSWLEFEAEVYSMAGMDSSGS
jgi:alpha-L-arabinofuranosidase